MYLYLHVATASEPYQAAHLAVTTSCSDRTLKFYQAIYTTYSTWNSRQCRAICLLVLSGAYSHTRQCHAYGEFGTGSDLAPLHCAICIRRPPAISKNAMKNNLLSDHPPLTTNVCVLIGEGRLHTHTYGPSKNTRKNNVSVASSRRIVRYAHISIYIYIYTYIWIICMYIHRRRLWRVIATPISLMPGLSCHDFFFEPQQYIGLRWRQKSPLLLCSAILEQTSFIINLVCVFACGPLRLSDVFLVCFRDHRKSLWGAIGSQVAKTDIVNLPASIWKSFGCVFSQPPEASLTVHWRRGRENSRHRNPM